MQTLTEINQQEVEKREAARQFEMLSNRKIALESEIARASAEVGDASGALTALKKILELAEDLPTTLHTSGQTIGSAARSTQVPGGVEVKGTILHAVRSGIQSIEQRSPKRRRELAAAQAELNTVNERLAAFES
jgi:chromosome segregation ATPase